mgnify:FL=1
MTITIETSLPHFEQLPENYAISLSEFGAISLSGEEQSKYLQGQVTCDVNSIDEHNLLHGAHCNAKGKTLAAFRLINHSSAYLLLQAKSSIETSLVELKKFGVFAKVDIDSADQLSFFALVGPRAAELIKSHYQQVPDSLNQVIQSGSTTIVYLAGLKERYLLIDENSQLQDFITQTELPVFSHQVWNLLEIKEGFPVLPETAIGEYVPQMLNLQAINGISFTKGCYLGQETVARMQYLGKNKRALFSLTGNAGEEEASPETIEIRMGDNWRKAGDVLISYRADNGQVDLQAVLASDIAEDAQLRIKGQEASTLSIAQLPYTN